MFNIQKLKFHYSDGGREAAGFKGKTSDCVVRAIAIATNIPYQTVYDSLTVMQKNAFYGSRKRKWKLARDKASKNYIPTSKYYSARNGICKDISREYLTKLGWVWKPTMFIGSGCKVHLAKDEIPMDRVIIAQLSKHKVCVSYGVIMDTYDCSRDATRCVYGYFYKPKTI